jgi:hypothetical protein
MTISPGKPFYAWEAVITFGYVKTRDIPPWIMKLGHAIEAAYNNGPEAFAEQMEWAHWYLFYSNTGPSPNPGPPFR